MFSFMKKSGCEKDDKEKKKKDKKDRKENKKRERGNMTTEELLRLDEVRRSLKIRGRRKEKEKLPSGITADYSASFFAELSRNNDGACGPSSHSRSDNLTQSDSSETSMTSINNPGPSHSNLPPLPPRPPKRGILKQTPKTSSNNDLLSQGDTSYTLMRNTLQNEVITYQNLPKRSAPDGTNEGVEDSSSIGSGDHTPSSYLTAPVVKDGKTPSIDSLTDSATNSSFATPPFSMSPVGESQSHPSNLESSLCCDLSLPRIEPVRLPKPRVLSISRQPPPRNDFGFSLRRAMVVQRDTSGGGGYTLSAVIFAEPGAIVQHRNDTGLLPGDRLLEVNGVKVDDKSREEVIEMIKSSGAVVSVKVQPVSELSELSHRSTMDGQTVELDDSNIRGGTLRRSGSRRFNHSNMAKTEEQVALERDWLQKDHLWLIHRNGFSAVTVLSHQPDIHKMTVSVDSSGEEIQIEEDEVEKANPPTLDRAEDLTQLLYVNESSVLNTLRQRYAANLIHTYAADVLVIINPMAPLAIYSEKVCHMFRGCKTEDMPPHIYATAQSAYETVISTRHDGSVVFMGHSASGKTTNFRHTLHYLALVAGYQNKVIIPEKLNAIWTLLEAFGNASTQNNVNATRFTHIFSLDFDQSGAIASASVQLLLNERWRVAYRPEQESTFHVFRRLIQGCDGNLRKELALDAVGENNPYIGLISKVEDLQKAIGEFSRLCGALTVIGVSDSEAKVIWSVISSILHLGAAGAVYNKSANRWQFGRANAAQRAAQLLGTTVDKLTQLLFGYSETGFVSPPEMDDGQLALDAFVVGLYSELFNVIGFFINRCITMKVHTVFSLLVVDSPGFQQQSSHGDSVAFYNLYINYLAERINQLFQHRSIVAPREQYLQEQVSLLDGEEEGGVCESSRQLLSALDSNSSSNSRGLFWLLDDLSSDAFVTDLALVDKLFNVIRENDGLIKKGPALDQITLLHCGSNTPVVYSMAGWRRQCLDHPLIRTAGSLLKESFKKEVSEMFVKSWGAGLTSTLTGSIVGLEGYQTLRKGSTMHRSATSPLKHKSFSLQLKFTVDGLIDTLKRTRIKFVQCLLPHRTAGLTDTSPPDTLINIPLVRMQIRGFRVLDAVRLYRQGFPKSMSHREFTRRFHLLCPTVTLHDNQEKAAVEEMTTVLDIDSASHRIGLSKIFFRAGVLPRLESQRDEKLAGRVVHFQAHCRGYLARKRFAKRKVEQLAVRCIQRNVRKFLSVRDWPWWRLLVRVMPLLNVHRTEEELRSKTEELENLKTKFEKLEQEKSMFQLEISKLEAKLSELTMDLAEERSSAALANQRLKMESAEKMRLEKELGDIQKQKQQLMENSERLEMELMYSRSSELNGALEGEGDDESAYKQRYERAARELAFTRRRLQQQHQDDLEQLVALKKQFEKKLSDAYEEVEEQRQVVGQWKRKTQKLASEMNDLRLLLEKQNSRNDMLEKKQRKFDTEIQLLTDELRQEKTNKERALREKEMALADKYTMEQNLSGVKLELELKEQKVNSLTAELSELTFSGSTEEDVGLLKKAKHQLQNKVKEQEEELDDLAGQVQLLEQAKLRLEMTLEQIRKENKKELAQRDEELEEVRCNAHKKVKALECQLENEHEQRTLLLRERHEMERKLAEYEEKIHSNRSSEQEQLQKLRRDLKRTKALLRDAQTTIEQSRSDAPNKAVMRQLRNQLEDAECARSLAVKAKQAAESERSEAASALEDATKARTEAEDRASSLLRERSQLQSQLDENEEELADVLKKYRATVQQLSQEQMSLQEQASRIAELETERSSLREQLAELSTRVESMETMNDPNSSLAVKRLQLKTKELESKLELEQTTRSRLQVQITRLKENNERLQSEVEAMKAREHSAQEKIKTCNRQLRELRDENVLLTSKEQEAQAKMRELEKSVDTAESDAAAARSDLRLALQRIEDLQCAIEGDMEDADDNSAASSDSDSSIRSDEVLTARSLTLGDSGDSSYQSADRSGSRLRRLNEPFTKDSSNA
ncbi:unconventional myosin-XVIIIa-like isoform X2 [Macrosteles quadrilineatus]|uniref:unconventional myosin-XVIIIa-like isoform X2 n=1 Tax=Macrosteles quadrilineatus TaxID=74068 RepID=UPI0023E22955|nr:unconventional myosin-XVIIIa-like isoform X2 [Macrosteles quadrilineatus]